MAEEELLKAIGREAEDKCRCIISEAEEQRETRLSRAKEEAREKKEKALAEHKGFLEKEADAKLNEARRRHVAEALEVKTAVIGGVFEEALKRIEKMDRERYSSYIGFLYEELREFWPPGVEARIHINPKDREIIVCKTADIELDEAVRLGVVFKSKDGSRRFENTAGSRLEKIRTELVIKLNNAFFNGDK